MYTSEFIKTILKKLREGEKVCNLCRSLHLSKATIYNWLKKNKTVFSKNEERSITYEDYTKLQIKFNRAIRELEIFQELHCFKDATIREKEQAIDKLVGKYPIKTMCRLIDLPTGTFYNYHFRRVQVTHKQIRDQELKQEVYRIFKESGERFGAKKIWIKLKIEGVNTTIFKVQSLMKLLNLSSKQRLRKTEMPKTENSVYYVNKLRREFNQTSPNKYWVGDITEVRVKRNKFYLCVILDLFSRKVVAYRLSSQNNTQLTINTFKDAYEGRNRPRGLSFHSDQGANYTAFEFRDLLHSLKVNQSFSKSGNPYDNACIESFFSNFKREEYNSKQYEYFDELQESIDSYMRFYNEYRPHQTLKNKTPDQFELEYYNEIE